MSDSLVRGRLFLMCRSILVLRSAGIRIPIVLFILCITCCTTFVAHQEKSEKTCEMLHNVLVVFGDQQNENRKKDMLDQYQAAT